MTAPLRGLGSREKVGELCHKRLESLLQFSSLFSRFSLHLALVFLGFILESKHVFLCSEVCVLLVPFACGQALFSVEILRVYPNVQDLGVSARLSESEEKETFH